MSTGICIRHHDRKATTRCHTCHKPLCSECAQKTPAGVFCSSDCEANHAKFAARYKDERRNPLVRAIKSLLTFAVIGAVILFIGAKVLKIGVFQNILKMFGF